METNVQLTPHDNLSSFMRVIQGKGKPFTGMGVIGVGAQVFSQRLGEAWQLHHAVDDIGLGPCMDILPAHEVIPRLAHLGYHVASYLQVPDARVPQAFWTHMEQTCSQAVYIASRNRDHAVHMQQVLEHAYGALLEKPSAVSVEAAEHIVQMVAEQRHALSTRSATAMCTLHYLHAANVLNLITSLHTGDLVRQLGKCHRVSGALLEADDLRHHRNSWLFDPAISDGDVLIDTGGHLLSILYGLGAQDLQVTEARWDTVLTEKPTVQIGEQQRQPATYFELDIEVSGGLFATGASGRLTVGKAVPQAGKYMQFECDKGCVDLTFPDGLTLRDVRRRPIPFTLSAAFAPQPYVNVLRRFLGQVQVGGAPETTFDIALACLRTIFAAYAVCRRTDFYARLHGNPKAVGV